MAKQKDYFAFRCAHKRESVLAHLKEQVRLLEDREYLIEETEDGFDLGIGRGGHQGGYWYHATVTAEDGGCLIRGRVEYRTWDGTVRKETWIDKVELALLVLLLLPLVVIVRIYRIFRPEVTDEDRFVEFMTTKMECEYLK